VKKRAMRHAGEQHTRRFPATLDIKQV